MAADHLGTYLQDHLAGAVMALELMEHIECHYPDAIARARISHVKEEVAADRRELQTIVDRLALTESTPRKAAAWLSERFARLKLFVDDPGDGSFFLFEAIELLSLGIDGKHALWRTLASVAPEVDGLQGVDYDRLMARATAQREILEPARLHLARTAFSVSGPGAATAANARESHGRDAPQPSPPSASIRNESSEVRPPRTASDKRV
jgi:hypothetical protein